MAATKAPEGTKFIGRVGVALLCADDMIKDPESGQFVRVMEQGVTYGPWHSVIVRVPDGRQVTKTYRKTARFNVYA